MCSVFWAAVFCAKIKTLTFGRRVLCENVTQRFCSVFGRRVLCENENANIRPPCFVRFECRHALIFGGEGHSAAEADACTLALLRAQDLLRGLRAHDRGARAIFEHRGPRGQGSGCPAAAGRGFVASHETAHAIRLKGVRSGAWLDVAETMSSNYRRSDVLDKRSARLDTRSHRPGLR